MTPGVNLLPVKKTVAARKTFQQKPTPPTSGCGGLFSELTFPSAHFAGKVGTINGDTEF